MADQKHTCDAPLQDTEFCDAQLLLKQLAEYLADLAAEEHLKQATQKRQP
ncbi:hypothetical protein [Kiloniella spongiae]|nr:hypothetical protein [Kiloniella spongiae]